MPLAHPFPSESHPAHGARPGFWASARRIAFHRPWRVTAVLAAVVALSLVDLDLTLLYSTTLGMVEINPIARSIMGLGSIWIVASGDLAPVNTVRPLMAIE